MKREDPHLHALKMPVFSQQTIRSPIFKSEARGDRREAMAVELKSVICSGCRGRACSSTSAK
jgi:hypothetical protein